MEALFFLLIVILLGIGTKVPWGRIISFLRDKINQCRLKRLLNFHARQDKYFRIFLENLKRFDVTLEAGQVISERAQSEAVVKKKGSSFGIIFLSELVDFAWRGRSSLPHPYSSFTFLVLLAHELGHILTVLERLPQKATREDILEELQRMKSERCGLGEIFPCLHNELLTTKAGIDYLQGLFKKGIERFHPPAPSPTGPTDCHSVLAESLRMTLNQCKECTAFLSMPRNRSKCPKIHQLKKLVPSFDDLNPERILQKLLLLPGKA